MGDQGGMEPPLDNWSPWAEDNYNDWLDVHIVKTPHLVEASAAREVRGGMPGLQNLCSFMAFMAYHMHSKA